MASVKNAPRHGLLTFAHGTIYGLQLLRHEVQAHIANSTQISLKLSSRKIAGDSSYDPVSLNDDIDDVDSPSDSVKNPSPKSPVHGHCCNCNCSSLSNICRLYSFFIMGLFQVTPHLLMLFYQKNVLWITIISLIAYCVNTIGALYYFGRFIYHYCFRKNYKFTLLDDIQSPSSQTPFSQSNGDHDIDQCSNGSAVDDAVDSVKDSVPLIVDRDNKSIAVMPINDDNDGDDVNDGNDSKQDRKTKDAVNQKIQTPKNLKNDSKESKDRPLLKSVQSQSHSVNGHDHGDDLDLKLSRNDLEMDEVRDLKTSNTSDFESKEIAPAISLEEYTQKFFGALLAFMSMLMIYNLWIGIYVFGHLLTPDEQYYSMPSIVFVLFAYPFIGSNLCFIEIQRMNELLHDTDISFHSANDEFGRTESGNLLSSNSSFWYIFGFVLNHFPILYFMTKTAAYVALFASVITDALGFDDSRELGERSDSAFIQNLGSLFEIAVFLLFYCVFLFESYFVETLLTGFFQLYPPIHNNNIENVRPPNNPCPKPSLEKLKNGLIKCINTLMPWSWMIESGLMIGCSVIILFYFAVWDHVIADEPEYAYDPVAGWSFVTVAVYQLSTITYAVIGERCCYVMGKQVIFTRNPLCCRQNASWGKNSEMDRIDCCCRCTRCCPQICKCCETFKIWCWCCCCFPFPCLGWCCFPAFNVSPDYKLRFMTFLESLSLIFKLMHFYQNAASKGEWYDIGMYVLIFSSIVTLFLLGFAGSFRSIHGLEVQSIMKSSGGFTLLYLLGFAFTQIVVYTHLVFAMRYEFDDIDRDDGPTETNFFIIFIWILISNVYTKEYRSLTKRIERDWWKKEGVDIKGWDRKQELPPMMGSLYHLLQLLMITAGGVIIYYVIDMNTIKADTVNRKFRKHLSIANLIATILILLISVFAVWTMSLDIDKLEEINVKKNEAEEKKLKKDPMARMKRSRTVYHDL